MKIEKICVEIVYFCEEFVSEMPTLACSLLTKKYFEYFPLLSISPSPPGI